MALKAVLGFLEEHNRPYSVLDVQNGLKGSDFGKGAIQKALDLLVEKDQVREKVYGKQKVYFITQNTDLSSKDLNEQILALDRRINETNSSIREVTDKIRTNAAQYEQAKGKLTLVEACEKKVELETELRRLKDALKEFDGVDPVAPEVKKKTEENYNKYLGIYRKRKRLCLDILDAILENYPNTKKHLYEDIGIETDEDLGFSVM
nr:PSMC3IP [Pagiophloeus tsushimanus]